MALINKKDIETLLNVQENTQNALCISIFIPTHRAGAETLNGQDSTLFKNKINEVKKLLAVRNLSEAEIDEYIKPAEELLHANGFWRHQGEGLAVFITKGFSTHYTLPIVMPEAVYVMNKFYFTPILPLLSQNGRFFVLWLYREKIRFYEATIDSIREVDITSFVPESMNESLKFDVKGNDQDYNFSRTAVNGTGILNTAQGFTQGDQQYDRVHQFMQDIDSSMQEILHDATEPLILAGVDHYCSIFRTTSKYKNIVPQNINVNEGVDGMKTIHEKAVDIMKPLMHQSHVESLDRYQNVAGTGVTSDDIATVAAEAVHGRVDTLFIAPSDPVWGTYDAVKATAEIHDEYHQGDDDLINLAAIKTISQGGRVFVSNYGGMAEVSDGQGNVKALFRY
ncbi:baeRF3 domain-containing protein [Pontibacter harenae]|uniref:baeRF3 domain-containing protein n=1 Tax=Pontibacter harenae TaxID=2894083 RepID=UPI001E29E056|nr:hypothetical protein [Pontibacter harenae]MCC9165407.1 hypothetical protein [Pontibacter harenae]